MPPRHLAVMRATRIFRRVPGRPQPAGAAQLCPSSPQSHTTTGGTERDSQRFAHDWLALTSERPSAPSRSPFHREHTEVPHPSTPPETMYARVATFAASALSTMMVRVAGQGCVPQKASSPVPRTCHDTVICGLVLCRQMTSTLPSHVSQARDSRVNISISTRIDRRYRNMKASHAAESL